MIILSLAVDLLFLVQADLTYYCLYQVSRLEHDLTGVNCDVGKMKLRGIKNSLWE